DYIEVPPHPEAPPSPETGPLPETAPPSSVEAPSPIDVAPAESDPGLKTDADPSVSPRASDTSAEPPSDRRISRHRRPRIMLGVAKPVADLRNPATEPLHNIEAPLPDLEEALLPPHPIPEPIVRPPVAPRLGVADFLLPTVEAPLSSPRG